ncbi:hypothetical protein AA0313_2489 [Acetobacter indonesiensis NRIC 0313]|uniref:Uncharacterized protein n=1 Tax=Acetobacter indonesiensis TaxID=104101 RepID=A0A6N3T3L1_9PROT|nr:hypothetical protein [Acetobacter indonesiensis]GAN62169.1 hypothetical protein Abin_006_159 [Acetobacter indonesiensis]GBQ60687.1 hypothetical protein AA0313_2489 [Acetobacter indonesiensis NRIC 0313]GEN02137.1 hypothetical protein AIN02nite_01620 [Acetobacter indonesiensis]
MLSQDNCQQEDLQQQRRHDQWRKSFLFTRPATSNLDTDISEEMTLDVNDTPQAV